MQAQGAVSYHVRETLRAAGSSSVAPSGIQLPPTVVRPRGLTPGHRRGRSAAKAYHLDLMKTILSSSLALALVSSATFANDSTWASLDQEIAGLSSSLTAQDAGSGPKIGGWMTATLTQQDLGVDGPDTENGTGDPTDSDELGFDLWKVRLEVTGKVIDGVSYKVSFDFADTKASKDGLANLKDAFIKTSLSDSFDLQFGRFKNPVLRSVLISDNKLLFVKRTLIGQAFDDRDEGAMLNGKFGSLSMNLAAQNSNGDDLDSNNEADGHTDSFKFTLRADWALLGTGAGSLEGAYGAADTNCLTIGGFYQDDSAVDNGTTWGLDAYMTMGSMSIAGEIVSLEEGFDNYDIVGASFDDQDDTMPWDVTVSFLITDNWEIAGRYEDLDTQENLTQASGSVSYYVNGHNAKWGLLYISQDSDQLGEAEEDELVLEATIAF